MAKAERAQNFALPTNYAKKMCNEVAYALLVHTMMLIFVTSPAIHFGEMSIIPYFLLVILVALAIPYLRNLEHKWRTVTARDEPGVKQAFLKDRLELWALTIVMPVAYMLFADILSTLFT